MSIFVEKHIRRLCLEFIDQFRPALTTDHAVMAYIRHIYPGISKRELSRELDYLELAGLLSLKKTASGLTIRMTVKSIDLLEGDAL